MITVETYADLIHLSGNFKPVFHLEQDSKDENLWRSFIFTDDFKELLAKFAPIFGNNQSKKKAYIMTGRYGVGKSHATAVLSHLLWDDYTTVQGKLEEAKRELGEWGETLCQFRQKSRLFPVILTQRNSKNVTTAIEFELELQYALEKALKENGFAQSVHEKTNYDRYIEWLDDLLTDDKRHQLLEYFNEYFASNSYFDNVTKIIVALEERDKQALQIAEDAFKSLKIPPPQHIDTIQYYKNVLKELQAADPTITGIVIYWDEFTTVFNTAGRYNDTTLIGAIQTWAEAELISKNIILFLVSHRSPEQLRGLYRHIDNDLALIQQRFYTAEVCLDKLMTYHLMAATLEISDEKRWEKFLELRGFSLDESYNRYLIRDLFGDLFGDISSRDEKYIRRTIPFHPYAVYVASRISNLIGSAERSIFELIYDSEEKSYEWGRRIGFSYFLSHEPTDGALAWYSIDNLFDYFFPSLDDEELEYLNSASVKKALNFFRQYFSVAQGLSEDHFRVFKVVILLESLHALTQEDQLLPSDHNIEKAFLFTEIQNINSLLTDLKDKALIVAHETRDGKYFYKTPYAGADEVEINEEINRVAQSSTFKKFIEEIVPDVGKYFTDNRLASICRIKNQQVNYTVLSAEEIGHREPKLRTLGTKNYVDLVIVLPQDYSYFQDAQTRLKALSKELPTVIFVLFEGNFERRYEGWLRATATRNVAQKKDNHEMFRDAQNRIETLFKEFVADLTKADVLFRGKAETKTEGLDREINRCVEKIYHRGFDRHTYQQFWGSAKKHSRIVLDYYGLPNGKQQLQDCSAMERRILDLFQSENGDPYIDSSLRMRDVSFVTCSPLYEIVTSIRNYIQNKVGDRINVGTMIRDLKLEEHPYGLCGWMESIIITYALAEFYAESRLEVVSGNGTPTKDAAKIVDVINNAIKKPDSDGYLRYGSPDEELLRTMFNQMFNFTPEKRTLKEISFTIRERANDSGVPLWVIPYNYTDTAHRNAIYDFINNLNHLVTNISQDQEYLELVSKLKEQIPRIEYAYGSHIWADILSIKSLREGLEKFVRSQNERLLTQYPSIDDLISDLKTRINQDSWCWQEWQVRETLNDLLISTPPCPPQNVRVKLSKEGVVITWNPSALDSPAPTKYILERSEISGSRVPITTISSGTTIYRDLSVSPGETYYYHVMAQNAAGRSEESTSEPIEVIPEPPQLLLNTKGHDNYIELNWTTPDPIYRIAKIDIYRGTSHTNLDHLQMVAKDCSSHPDLSVTPGIKYYYTIKATNIHGLEGPESPPEEAWTNPLAIRPMTPTSLNAAVLHSEIRLTWSPPNSGEDSVEEYHIYRGEHTDTIKFFDKVATGSREYVDGSVEPEIEYTYAIVAVNRSGESDPSQKVAKRILLDPPVVDLSAEFREDRVILRWKLLDSTYGISKYIVYRGKCPEDLDRISSEKSTESSFVDKLIEIGQTYFYRVTALNEQGVEGATGIPRAVTSRISVDIDKWIEESSSVALGDLNLFLNVVSTILGDILSSRYQVSEQEARKIAKLRKIISGELDD